MKESEKLKSVFQLIGVETTVYTVEERLTCRQEVLKKKELNEPEKSFKLILEFKVKQIDILRNEYLIFSNLIKFLTFMNNF